ncbi:glycosyltransferase family 2 protein [Marinobacter nauticus]|uniref:Glycosyl transferase, family 2 n=1 Tax=Marinobacter nauticus (strain ATCC 700491 / DSM 11845 / VT8) TaxID=351348 RepID=A1U3X3_MARN8|nr:glycosyltransferase family 2 protein [Marinobacter nauticus]ABM19692.1 glycosyl transferase, family 2 [Marinobacter nauticus VT8]
MADCSISIIIPAYNVDHYLGAALDSIKAQSELPDEVILIDDGSTDRTLEVARAYEFSVPYRVVPIENGGQGNARNIGVGMASSQYIYFFDSDDLLTENFISSIKKRIRDNQRPDIVLFSGESFNDRDYQGNRWSDYRRGFSGMYFNRAEFLDQAYSHNALFCSPCLYVSKKSLWGPDGLAFGPNFLEDEALFYPVLFACDSFLVIDEVFFLRRNREGSTMNMDLDIRHVNGALNCMESALRLYKRKSLSPRERWHVRKRLKSYCLAYVIKSKRIGASIRLKEVLIAIVKTRSLSLSTKALLYSIRADQSTPVQGIGRLLKRLARVVKG